MKKPKLSDSLKEELLAEISKGKRHRTIGNFFLIALVIVFGVVLKVFVLTDDTIRIADNSTRSPEEKIESQPEVKGEETSSTTRASVSVTTTTTVARPEFTEYTVQEGDTLGEIANTNGLTSEELMSYNGIVDPTSIKPGQIIKIPN